VCVAFVSRGKGSGSRQRWHGVHASSPRMAPHMHADALFQLGHVLHAYTTAEAVPRRRTIARQDSNRRQIVSDTIYHVWQTAGSKHTAGLRYARTPSSLSASSSSSAGSAPPEGMPGMPPPAAPICAIIWKVHTCTGAHQHFSKEGPCDGVCVCVCGSRPCLRASSTLSECVWV